MSALIKSGEDSDLYVTALGGRAAARTPVVEADPKDVELVRLQTEVARLEKRISESRNESAEAIEGARETGRLAGMAEAVALEEARLEMLRDGIDAAVATFAIALDRLDGLALQLVRATFDKLFSTCEDWAPMVCAAVERQLATLRRASVRTVHVSPADFDSVDALLTGEMLVVFDPGLRSGAARIECRLGQIDLDVREQWAELAALLDAMSIEDSV